MSRRGHITKTNRVTRRALGAGESGTSVAGPSAEPAAGLATGVVPAAWAVALVIWTGVVADLDGPPGRLCGAAIAGVAVAIYARRQQGRSSAGGSLLGLLTFALATGALAVPRIGPWLAASVGIGILWLSGRHRAGNAESPQGRSALVVLTLLVGCHFAVTLFVARSAFAWHVTDAVAGAVSRVAMWLHVAHVSFGSSQLLLPAVGTLLLPVVLMPAWDRRWLKTVLVALAVVFLGLVATAAVGSCLTLHPHRTTVKVLTGTLAFQATALGLWAIVAAATYARLPLSAPSGSTRHGRRRKVALVLGCLLPLGVTASGWHGETARVGTVLVYRDNPGDFRIPDMKTWGKHAAGRFGLLCDYLRSLGYPSAYTAPGQLERDLRAATAIVLPQPTKRLSAEDLRALRMFVARGGGLLYLLDHTNVGRCMLPANDVLAPYGIRPKFDTALPAKTGWWTDLKASGHPTVCGMSGERCEAGWWVGASLNIERGAQPLLVGTRCWSDWGNTRNVKRAYLGNYRIDRRERVGDLVLAASGNTRSSGRVIAFGDTSTPQNLAVAQSWRYLGRTMSWLTARPEWQGWRWARTAGLVAMVIGCLALVVQRARLSIVALLVAGTLAAGLAPEWFRPSFPRALPGRDVVLVYAPALGRYSLESMKEDGLWGTQLAVARAGKLPRIIDTLDPRELAEARFLLMVSPGGSLSGADGALLSDWVMKGGQLTVACAPEDWHSFSRMPIFSGAEVTSHSLGNGQATDIRDGVRYACMAYSLAADESIWRPLLFRLGECFAAMSVRGRGRVTLIADPAFVTCRNTEGEKDGHVENCRWLSSLWYSARTRSGVGGAAVASGMAPKKPPTPPAAPVQ